MINEGMLMPGIGNISYINEQIMNLQNQLMNIKMPMNNNMGMSMNNDMLMPMNNFMGIPINNFMGMQMNNNMEALDNIKKMNITFKTTQGISKNIVVDYGTSIDNMLKKYLKEVNHPELINSKDKICFLFNARKLKFGDKTKIEDYFKNTFIPKIVVNEVM